MDLSRQLRGQEVWRMHYAQEEVGATLDVRNFSFGKEGVKIYSIIKLNESAVILFPYLERNTRSQESTFLFYFKHSLPQSDAGIRTVFKYYYLLRYLNVTNVSWNRIQI